jgi:hypothetical protein
MNSNIKGAGLPELFDALIRLVENKPERVKKGSKISLRIVALEAGKDPSIIRKDRDIYAHLIEDIEKYAAIQKEKSAKKNGQIAELKARIANSAVNPSVLRICGKPPSHANCSLSNSLMNTSSGGKSKRTLLI